MSTKIDMSNLATEDLKAASSDWYMKINMSSPRQASIVTWKTCGDKIYRWFI